MKKNYKIVDKILSVLFPKKCPYCGEVIFSDEYACKACIDELPSDYIISAVTGGFPCISAFFYKNEKYRKAVLRFKFGNKKYYADTFAVSIANDIKSEYNDITFDYITCVPLHKERLAQRGYNQAELLARSIGSILNIEYIDLLEKYKINNIQHSISKAERKRNIHNVYRLLPEVVLEGKTILICDDIVTTGYTIGECCRVLDKADVKMIYCASILKA